MQVYEVMQALMQQERCSPCTVQMHSSPVPKSLLLAQAHEVMRVLMQQERRRIWSWWDDLNTRDTENSRGRCPLNAPLALCKCSW